MTYGLRIINDDSELLVDSEYFSPAFVQKLEFNTTPVATEAATGQLHTGYVKRTYNTSAITAPGNYIVMWTIPDNGTSDVWYSFETSTTTIMGVLTCYVYANSTGAGLTYTLPTAYLFTTDTLPASTGPALRMYSSGTPSKKTFDSNNIQLAPYSISDAFAFSTAGTNPEVYGATPVSISIGIPSNPIFMVPDYAALRIKQNSGFSEHYEYIYASAFKRVGTTLSTRLFITYYSFEDYYWAESTYTTGRTRDLSVIVADANLYEAVSGGSGGGANPTYTLTSSTSSVAEGASFTITLNTTLVANNTEFPYTVTGITASDLTAGGISGSFIITNNTSSITFTVATDTLAEGTETFTLTLTGLNLSVNVSITDPASSYSFNNVASINEGGSSSATFNYVNAANKTITFSLVNPSTGTSAVSDAVLTTTSYTVPNSNSAGTVSVSFSVASDRVTEGAEYFRIRAIVDSVSYYSNDILVNDTSKTPAYSITANSAPWAESSTKTAAISILEASGDVLYFTTDNALVVPVTSSITVPNNAYTTNISYSVGDLAATTTVTLHIRSGSTSGAILASTTVSVTNIVTPSYTLSQTWSSMSPGASGIFLFSATNAAGNTVTFSKSGAGASYISITPTSVTVPDAYEQYQITVSYPLPAAAVPAQSVTISTSSGQSFTFTLLAYNPNTVPLVVSVEGLTSERYFYRGETYASSINMAGPITSGTYVKVTVFLGGIDRGHNIFQGGVTKIPDTLPDPNFPLGASSGFYETNPNYSYNTSLKIGAKTLDVNGVDLQDYVYGPTVQISTSFPP